MNTKTSLNTGQMPKLCIVQPWLGQVSESFLKAHADRLPADVSVIHDFHPTRLGDEPVLPQGRLSRATRAAGRWLRGKPWEWEITQALLAAFRRCRPDAVLAEYGPVGVLCLEACRQTDTPLIVHFHGYDASRRETLQRHAENYRRLFRQAAAIIAVSRPMRQRLIELGAPEDKVHLNVYGADCGDFRAALVRQSEPMFLAVGRMVEKKGPELTLAAFAKVHAERPESRLRMIGDGSLLDSCRERARRSGVAHAVEFLGPQPHSVVRDEMQRARCFVQHSIEASNGECEGTPVAVIEAGASGLPVVATRHAGIPDVVLHEETGLLVDEHDVDGMAQQMRRVISDPAFAARLGEAARSRIYSHYSMDESIRRLWSVIERAIARPAADPDESESSVEIPVQQPAGALT